MKRVLLSLFLLCVVSPLSAGCLIFWALNEDPENLPCKPGTQEPRCKSGYVCILVDADEICVKPGVLKEGDSCDANAQCSDGLLCADAYGPDCDRDRNKLNCEPGGVGQLECRAICDPAKSAAEQCDPGERCFPDGDSEQGWCQGGSCEVNADCGTGLAGVANVCVEGRSNDDGSGLCFYGCDPFLCTTDECADCPNTGDLTTDDVWNCASFEGGRFGCLITASQKTSDDGQDETCSGDFDCAPRHTCANGTCSQYCDPGGAAPACPAGSGPCTMIPSSTAIGYCP